MNNDPMVNNHIAGKVAYGTLPPTPYQLRALVQRYGQAPALSEGTKARQGSAKQDSAVQAALRVFIAQNDKYANYRDESHFQVITNTAVQNRGRKFQDQFAMRSKGCPIYAFSSQGTCVLTEPLWHTLTAKELEELVVHGQTVELGMQDVYLLRISGAELRAVLDELLLLNGRQPGWGITQLQQERVIETISLTISRRESLEALDYSALAKANLNSLFDALDIAPRLSHPVKYNALHFLADLRERDVDLYGDAKFSAERSSLDRRIEAVQAVAPFPKDPIRIGFVSFGSPWHYALWNNLSIDTLAGDLYGEFGKEVQIELKRAVRDVEVDQVVADLKRLRPNIVGLSIELGTLRLVERFVDRFNQLNWTKRPLLVLGNQLPTYFPERFIEDDWLKEAIICLHEGEFAMRGLVEHVRGQRSLTEIDNLVFRDPQTGDLRRTPLCNLSLTELPHPPTVDTAKPGITNMIQTSRGCIFRCSYCTRWHSANASRKLSAHGPTEEPEASLKWRPFPLPRVFESVERFVAKGITEIEFCDDEFFGGRTEIRLKRVHDFAKGMKRIAQKYGVKLSFRLFTTPSIVARNLPDHSGVQEQNHLVRNALEHLIEAGLVRVYIGLESGNIAQKRRYDRGETIEDTTLSLNVLRELGLNIDVGFIMFDPHLTVAEMLENVAYFRKNELVKHNTWPFRPLVVNEGTVMKAALEGQGLLTGKQDPDFLAYEYRFADPMIARIAALVQAIAKETGAIFYALKTISKTHWNNQRTETTHFAQWALEKNALIYLDLMEALGRHAQSELDPSFEQRCIDETRAAVLRLIEAIEHKLKAGLFDERGEDRKILSDHLYELRSGLS